MKQERSLLEYNRSERTYRSRFLIVGLLLVIVFFSSSYYIYRHPVFDKPKLAAEQLEGMPQRNTKGSFRKITIDEKYKFYIETQPATDGKQLYVYLTNMYYNNVLLRVQIFDEKGNKVGQSDLCTPGHYIENIDVDDLEKGSAITMKVISYEIDTYHSRGNIDIKAELPI